MPLPLCIFSLLVSSNFIVVLSLINIMHSSSLLLVLATYIRFLLGARLRLHMLDMDFGLSSMHFSRLFPVIIVAVLLFVFLC